MPTNSSLGTCPSCHTRVDERHVLIRYEKNGSEPALFAECPGCADVVYFD
jgi:RNase P subunit RPR2